MKQAMYTAYPYGPDLAKDFRETMPKIGLQNNYVLRNGRSSSGIQASM